MQAFHCADSAHSWSCKVDLRVRKLPKALGSRVCYQRLEKQYESFEFFIFKNQDMQKANTKVRFPISERIDNRCPATVQAIKPSFAFGDLLLELQLQILELVVLPGDVYLQVYTKRWDYGCRTIERLYHTIIKY